MLIKTTTKRISTILRSIFETIFFSGCIQLTGSFRFVGSIKNRNCSCRHNGRNSVLENELLLSVTVEDNNIAVKALDHALELKTVCEKNANIKSYIIEDESELDKSWFIGINTVSITSGASTPEEITDKVVKKIESFI